VKVGFVLGVLVVGVDLEGVQLDDGAQEVEAGVLIPSAAFVEIDEGKQACEAKKCGEFPMRCGRWRHWRQ
jgi:hypothetical protein